MSTSNPTFAQDILEMMSVWTKIVAAARVQFPRASEERIFEIASGAMNHVLGVKG